MKRKFVSLIVTICMLLSMAVPTFAYSTYYAGGNYYMSDWAQNLEAAYDPIWKEAPQRQVKRIEAFLLFLRATQRSLDRQGYTRFTAGYSKLPFTDYNSVNPQIQGEVNVLWTNGLLIGYDDGEFKPERLLSRAEMAAIYSRFNRLYFNMGQGYYNNEYNGYNDYYNNNYNNYYNNYVFNDVIGHWAQQDIITAASNGVLAGVGNGYFDTEGPLTIEQIWQIIDRCVGYQGLKRSDIAYAMERTFKVTFGKKIDENYNVSGGIKITSLSATPTTLSINEGETRNIKVNIYPSNSQYQKLNWTSSNTNYVSVEETWNSSSGIAYVSVYGRRATSNYITLTGRAMDGSGKYVTVKIKVNSRYDDDYDYGDDYVTSISLSESTIYLKQGESRQVTARVKPSSAYNKNLSWRSNNTNIAYVSNNYTNSTYSYATINGNSIGTTYIYVTAQDGSGTQEQLKVIVQSGNYNEYENITSATANPSQLSISIGDSRNISITTYPTNAINKNINWMSRNENVAVVEKISNTSIRITGIGVGTTSIVGLSEATGNTVCTIPVTVSKNGGIYVPPDTGDTDTVPPVVTLEGATNVNIGDSITIIAKASDANLSNFNIGVNSIIGMTGSLSPTKIEKISNTEYRITLMGVEVASQCICIAAGAAVDSAGNYSEESNEIVIFVNSGENW